MLRFLSFNVDLKLRQKEINPKRKKSFGIWIGQSHLSQKFQKDKIITSVEQLAYLVKKDPTNDFNEQRMS